MLACRARGVRVAAPVSFGGYSSARMRARLARGASGAAPEGELRGLSCLDGSEPCPRGDQLRAREWQQVFFCLDAGDWAHGEAILAPFRGRAARGPVRSH